jgi:outer membrane protein assembly factor BamB
MKPPRTTALGLARTPESVALWRAVQWVAIAFLLAMGVVMSLDLANARRDDPFKSHQLKSLKDQLRDAPKSDALKQQIRDMDLRLRERHFRRLTRMRSGAWLMTLGGALLAYAAGRSKADSRSFDFLRQKAAPDAGAMRRRAATALGAVGVSGAAAAVFLVWLGAVGAKSPIPGTVGQVDKLLGIGAEPAAPDCASESELNKSWPRFRGPGGNGIALSGKAPASWGGEPGQGVLWKNPSPVSGFNSPIVFGGFIYFSGGDASGVEVVCLRLSDGQLAWRKAIEATVVGEHVEIPESTGYAPSTMATDGRRVYAIFANGVAGAFTMDGKPAWAKSFGPLHNAYGHAISLAAWRDRLIVQLDQGESGEGRSVLYALDGRTGRPVWQKPRTVGASWASPIVIEAAGKPQIITLSVPWVISHSAETGAELWRADCLNGEVTPSPVFAGGKVVVPSPSDRIMALRPDGKGDVSKSHIEWSFDEDIPDVTSPVSNGELLFFVTTSGLLTCVDMKDGKRVWNHDFAFDCHASPAIADGKLYQLGQEGSVVVIEASREFKELFRVKMPDSFHASPAFAEETVILRGMTNIWRVGAALAAKQGGQSD